MAADSSSAKKLQKRRDWRDGPWRDNEKPKVQKNFVDRQKS